MDLSEVLNRGHFGSDAGGSIIGQKWVAFFHAKRLSEHDL
jgi:hypothetical protein